MTAPQPDGFRPPAPPPAIPVAPAPAYTAPGGPAYPAPGTPAYPSPAYQAPVGAYQVPAGGYTQSRYASNGTEPASRTTGALSLILALAASVVIPIVGALATYEIGRRLPSSIGTVTDFDSLAFLSPARDQVLWAEMSFWGGTVIGIIAFILGVIAIVKRRGRGMGIAGIVVSVLGPVIFFTAAMIAFTIGAAAGSMGYYA